MFEQLWLNMFAGRDVGFVLVVFSFVMHELFYFGRYLPFFLLDFFPSMKKYKLQPKKENSAPLIKKCLYKLLINHFFIQLPMMLGFHPLAEMFGMKIVDVFPTWQSFLLQITVFFIFEDFYHYWMHRAMHIPSLYKHVHKVHHEFSAPFGITAEYAHPIETVVLGFGTVGGPVLWVMATGDLHVVTMFTWIILRLLQTVDAHSGYDFPFSLHNWFPFWAGAEHHDYHHMAFINNFSSSFRWWDTWFGTDLKYLAHKEQQKATAAAKKVQ
ncbi:fatty acid hydroxylase superfamily-domain-containing protein [Thamnocephalis sphaerospora]|uniref:Fatty acid hydroxylase superfamily-domain-containing protein n=1 Tax=Thamnocephalis sphaerospora TaxID=78915 RepID=A0A4P9XI97_9FUNG|nr:fatty acid hydroxylase superfamily-domain-containing protein [Thamnocephalis sphaerospora]|eukprot:RKP05402.1 fatty acid hydroxylase superfamily-domain-containing protein [Thamnocephalis sphaerospora]